MNGTGNLEGLTIVAKLHVKDKHDLYEHLPDAIRMGVTLFGGTVEEHPHQMLSPWERDIRIIHRFRQNNEVPVIAEIRPNEVMEGYVTRDALGVPSIDEVISLENRSLMGSSSTLFKCYDRVDAFHMFPEIPACYAVDGRQKLDDSIAYEMNNLVKNGSKPVILEVSPKYAVDDYSDIAQTLIGAGQDLIMSVGINEEVIKVSYLKNKFGRPVYLNLGNVDLLDGELKQLAKKGLESGASGVIVDVPVNGQGLEPLRETINYLADRSTPN